MKRWNDSWRGGDSMTKRLVPVMCMMHVTRWNAFVGTRANETEGLRSSESVFRQSNPREPTGTVYSATSERSPSRTFFPSHSRRSFETHSFRCGPLDFHQAERWSITHLPPSHEVPRSSICYGRLDVAGSKADARPRSTLFSPCRGIRVRVFFTSQKIYRKAGASLSPTSSRRFVQPRRGFGKYVVLHSVPTPRETLFILSASCTSCRRNAELKFQL